METNRPDSKNYQYQVIEREVGFLGHETLHIYSIFHKSVLFKFFYKSVIIYFFKNHIHLFISYAIAYGPSLLRKSWN